jgi:uncharacterized protein YndB with AHSA1/START domain
LTQTIAVAPVRKQVRVAAPAERAFEIFTAGMGRWWPKGHSIGSSPQQDVIIEPRSGGVWKERGEDGSEVQWGKVLAWEPPSRVLLGWQLNPQWQFDPNLLTELEIRFTPDGEGTLVELEHRMQGYGEAAEPMRQQMEGPEAWEGLLKLFAEAVA